MLAVGGTAGMARSAPLDPAARCRSRNPGSVTAAVLPIAYPLRCPRDLPHAASETIGKRRSSSGKPGLAMQGAALIGVDAGLGAHLSRIEIASPYTVFL